MTKTTKNSLVSDRFLYNKWIKDKILKKEILKIFYSRVKYWKFEGTVFRCWYEEFYNDDDDRINFTCFAFSADPLISWRCDERLWIQKIIFFGILGFSWAFWFEPTLKEEYR